MILMAAISLIAGAQAQLFATNEVGPTVFGAYNLNTKDVGVGLGIQYFPLQKYVGIEASTVFYNFKGLAFDNVDGAVLLRLPLELQRLAPAAVVGVHHDLETSKTELTLGAQLEYRVNSKWSVFGRYERLMETEQDVLKAGLDLRF